ncbi:centromere protein T-like isoform X2 [Erpetoichthys calabaricus]|uniref:centromere protein T-like isoform X2 n=1 Tax=Erpetoichthys calabaricus TaxID=27687 RepID=UPI00223402E5|nr:centromere protein T-like isoform X2 [Erpetoichthys calabaricus]
MKTFKCDESSLSDATESPSPKCILKQIIQTEPVSEPLVKNKPKPFEDLFSNAEKSRFRFKTPHTDNIGDKKLRKSEVNIQSPALASKSKMKKQVEKSAVKLPSTLARPKMKTFNSEESSLSVATENLSSRYILKQIIQTEPVSEPLVINKPRMSKPPPLADPSLYIEKSGLSMSLKTPNVEEPVLKRGIRHKVGGHKTIDMKAFEEGVFINLHQCEIPEGCRTKNLPSTYSEDEDEFRAEDSAMSLVNNGIKTKDVTVSSIRGSFQNRKSSEIPVAAAEATISRSESVINEEDETGSEELCAKTPAFIRGRKRPSSHSSSLPPLFFNRNLKSSKSCVRKPAQSENERNKSRCIEKQFDLPKNVVLSTFSHFAGTKVSKDAYPSLQTCVGKYFDSLADDLGAYVHHAKRKTVEREDLEFLMKRQGFVTQKTPLNVLIERHLTLEYRKLLIPVASSGNNITPNI